MVAGTGRAPVWLASRLEMSAVGFFAGVVGARV